MGAVRAADLSDDAQVIERSLLSPASFGVIFERHFRPIHRFLAARVGASLADDLAAQVFVVAFQRRSSYRPGMADSALPWLYGIAHNLLRTARRSERRHLAALRRLGAVGARGTVDPDHDVDPRLRERLVDTLAALPADQRDALLLHVLGGLTYADVAGSLGIPEGTASSRIGRARRRLRAALGDLDVECTRSDTQGGSR